MTAEHLLDAMGQLDDRLIQEAEAYRRPHHGRWAGLAASVAVVLVLGYGLTFFRGGGGPACGGASGRPAYGSDNSGGACSAEPSQPPSVPDLEVETPPAGGMEMLPGTPGDPYGGASDSNVPSCVPAEGLTVLADGAYYRSTGEIIRLSPGEDAVSCGLTWQASGEETPEPSRRWLALEDGTIAVDCDGGEWLIFAPLP